MNKCCEYFQWDLVINILVFSPFENKNKEQVISTVWSNLFQDQLWNDNLGVAVQRINEVCNFIMDEKTKNTKLKASLVFDPSILMPVFENHRLSKNGYELWAVNAMLNVGLDKDKILEAYLNALQDRDIKQNKDYEN